MDTAEANIRHRYGTMEIVVAEVQDDNGGVLLKQNK